MSAASRSSMRACVSRSRWLAMALVALATLNSAAANLAPSVSLTAPQAGSQFNAPATIRLSATATDSDGSVAKVEFYRGTVLVGTVLSAPFDFDWANVAVGAYSITAKAYDNLNKAASSAAVQIQVINATTVITSPAAGAVVEGLSAQVTGTFVGADSTSVILTAGAGHSAVANVGGGTFSGTVALSPGPNIIDVQVARRDGTWEIVSRGVTAVEPPIVVMTGPVSNQLHAPSQVTLTADAVSPQGSIDKVEFWNGSTSLGTVLAPPYAVTASFASAGTFPSSHGQPIAWDSRAPRIP